MKNHNIIITGGTDGRIKAARVFRAFALIAFIILMLVSIWVQIIPVKVYISDSSNTMGPISQITIVTGASKNHFCQVKAFIYTMKSILRGLDANIIVYDLGLRTYQSDELKKIRDEGYFYEFRAFNFSAYPSFWDISEARGEYAWKPGIVEEVSKTYPGIVTWLDSGTLPERKYFENLRSLLRENDGFFSPRSSGDMKTWTHQGVYEFYGDDASKYDDFPNCNGASMAFDTFKTQHIIDDWYSCALIKDCIAPEGSSRKNHRQDQAILTYLAAREGRYCQTRPGDIGINVHQDSNCQKIVTFYEELYHIE